jgi:hypothetical protein
MVSGLIDVHANHVHLHVPADARININRSPCLYAYAEWHMCEGPGKVVWRGGACAKGAKGCIDVEEPCDGEWVAIVVHHGAGQEATQSACVKMHRSVEAPRASDGVVDVGGQLEGSKAHESTCSTGVGHVEVQRTCEVHD